MITAFIVVLALALLLVATGLLYQWMGVMRDSRRFPAPGRLIQAGAQRLHYYSMGQGRPTVILEAGISATCVNWRRVQDAVSQFTGVLSYDRAGLGWSDPARTPRNASQVVEELRELLRAAAVPSPYILVGHSFGGLVVRLYATRYPQDVAALVLVDPLRPEEWHPLTKEQRRNLAGGALLSRYGALLARLGVVRFTLARLAGGSRSLPRMIGRATSTGAGLATMERLVGEVKKMPQELWPSIMSHWCLPKSFASMGDHLARLPESVASMIDASRLHMPVTILTGIESRTAWLPEEIQGLSIDVTHIVAEKSGHWIQLDEPDVVVTAIRDSVIRVREGEQDPLQIHFPE